MYIQSQSQQNQPPNGYEWHGKFPAVALNQFCFLEKNWKTQ